LQSEEITVLEALLIGIQMNFRAIVMLIGFSAIGTELYNPVIRAFFLRTSFRQLPMALELSFESLPAMIAFLPPVKILLKNPVSVMQQIIAMAETRLEEIRQKQQFKRKIFIISGKVGEGKTRILEQLVGLLKENNISTGGILAPRIMENGQTIGYDLLDLTENLTCSFLRLHDGKAGETIGRYFISNEGIHFGNEALSVAKNLENKLVVIDEIGKLELSDRGWAPALNELLATSDNHLILSVRDSFVEQIIEKWGIEQNIIFQIHESESEEVLMKILQAIQ
jgi:nucleoside-triphosphatase THEP1